MDQKPTNIYINNNVNTKFLRALNYEQLIDYSNRVRATLIDVTSKNGGHLSSNLGVVELSISLHRNFDFTKDKLLFDVGHQSYTHKIITGRDISTLRKDGGVSGFIKTKESPFDIFEAGHSSTSLSAAEAFAIDRDNKKENYEVVTLIGDASIANGVAFEALNTIPSSNHKVIVVLNDNGMAISKPVGGLSNFFRNFQTSKSYEKFKRGYKKTFGLFKPFYNLGNRIKNWLKRHLIATNIFDALGLIYIGMIDGHDFKELDKAFAKAKKINKSVLIHVRTTKGKGYSFAENDKEGNWHGVGPFDKTTGVQLDTHEGMISWSEVYSNFVLDKLASDNKFYLVCPGTLNGSNLERAKAQYPDRVIDTGISEEHAIILASQLAKLNYHVCVSIYSTFMQRGYDEILHDVARIQSPVTFLVDRSGLVGRDGETHQGIYDSAFLNTIPNVKVVMAANQDQAYQLFDNSFNSNITTFIRYPRDYITSNVVNKKSKVNNYEFIKQSLNNNCAIISTGPLAIELFKQAKDLDASLILLTTLNPLDESLICSLLNYSKIVIYTPYETSEGLASNLVKALAVKGLKSSVFIKAVPTAFIPQASIEEQLNKYNLLPSQIVNFIKEII